MNYLNYQPFIIANDIQTGAAHSPASSADLRSAPPLVFKRQDFIEECAVIADSNSRLRAMRDDFLDELVAHSPEARCSMWRAITGIFP